MARQPLHPLNHNVIYTGKYEEVKIMIIIHYIIFIHLCIHYMIMIKRESHAVTFPSLSYGESKLSRNWRNTWSSDHSPFWYFGWYLALYTPLRSSTVITPSPLLSSFRNACMITSFLALDIGGYNYTVQIQKQTNKNKPKINGNRSNITNWPYLIIYNCCGRED